jgi:xylulokinase
MPALLGIDIGTTSTIGILIDTEGRTLATASRPADLLSPEANWAEEDPAQWWSNSRAVIAELLGESGLAGADIAAVGTTGMVPALVLLDAEGRVLRRSMQQNDARALAEIDEMGRRIHLAPEGSTGRRAECHRGRGTAPPNFSTRSPSRAAPATKAEAT